MPYIAAALFSCHDVDQPDARKFLLHLLRVQESMARRLTRIEPSHDRLRLRGPTLRETKHSAVSCCRALEVRREKRRVQHASISAVNPHQVMLADVFRQLEPVGSGRWHASGNLQGLTKSDFVGLIRLICLCGRQGDQDCKQEQNGDKIPYDDDTLHKAPFSVTNLCFVDSVRLADGKKVT